MLPALYGSVSSRWVTTRVVSLNEPLQFVIFVQRRVPGWSRLHVHLRIRRTFIGRRRIRGALPTHIFRVGKATSGTVGSYARYSVVVAFHSRAMLGVLFAAFHVSRGPKYTEGGFFFRVYPSHSH